MAALAIRGRLPQLQARTVRSPDIDVIGVGESTEPEFPAFLFDSLAKNRGFRPRLSGALESPHALFRGRRIAVSNDVSSWDSDATPFLNTL